MRRCGSEVMERFDHVNLNLRPEFAAQVPTTENLSEVIYEILKQNFTRLLIWKR